jgi:hypothetical protein
VRCTERMSELPSGWVVVPGTSFRRTMLNSQASVARIFATRVVSWTVISGILFTNWAYDLWGFTAAVATVAAIIVTFVIVVLLFWHRNPAPEINFDTGELRLGRSVAPFGAVTEAQFLGLPSADGVDWYLRFGAHVAPSATVVVRSSRLTELDADQRRVVAELIRRSAVAIPARIPDPYDPKGKFAWMDHPNHLTRDEAIEYVLHTPESGEPVRTPPRPKSIWIDEDD